MNKLLERSGGVPLEVVVEVTPRWLALQGASAQKLLDLMAGHGFLPYILREDYEVGRCADGLNTPGRPRRLREGETLDAYDQCDVIFSRTNAAWL